MSLFGKPDNIEPIVPASDSDNDDDDRRGGADQLLLTTTTSLQVFSNSLVNSHSTVLRHVLYILTQ
jgi:hypothetical protein